MKIEGTPEEIADFVLELQNRHSDTHVVNNILKTNPTININKERAKYDLEPIEGGDVDLVKMWFDTL